MSCHCSGPSAIVVPGALRDRVGGSGCCSAGHYKCG